MPDTPRDVGRHCTQPRRDRLRVVDHQLLGPQRATGCRHVERRIERHAFLLLAHALKAPPLRRAQIEVVALPLPRDRPGDRAVGRRTGHGRENRRLSGRRGRYRGGQVVAQPPAHRARKAAILGRR